MKRIISIVFLLMLAVTGLVGAQDEPVLLTFFTTEADPSQLQALATIIDEYHAMNPNVFVDVVTGTPSTRGDRIKTLLSAGADAGIFEVESAFANSWAEAGYLLPLDDIYAEMVAKITMSPVAYSSAMIPRMLFPTQPVFMECGFEQIYSKRLELLPPPIMKNFWWQLKPSPMKMKAFMDLPLLGQPMLL